MNQPPNFNPLAGLYRWMEFLSFGPWLSLTRQTFLGDLSGCRRALVLGDGDGRFTARLLKANSSVQIDAVDGSSAMLRALVARAGPEAARVQTHLADIRDWQPEAGAAYDLVATHFFLDCLTTGEVELLAVRLRAAVTHPALWVVSEFAVPPGWFGTIIARPVVAGLYGVFGCLTGLGVRSLPDYAGALNAAGFFLLQRRPRLGGLLVSELWAARAPNTTVAAG